MTLFKHSYLDYSTIGGGGGGHGRVEKFHDRILDMGRQK